MSKKASVPARLKGIGDARLTELRERLKSGDSPLKLAEMMQTEWKVCTDIQPASLKKLLERYRAKLKVEVVAAIAEASVGKTTTGLLKRLNVMDEIEELAVIQKRRFHKMLMKEDQGPLLLKQVSEEIRVYQGLLNQMATLQLETGVLKRVPKHVTGVLTDHAGQTMEFSWTEEHDKLLEVLDGECRPVN